MKLQDYIHYYIGCRCFNTWFPDDHPEYDRGWILRTYRTAPDTVNPYGLETEFGEYITSTDSIKPILRRAGDITEEEFGKVDMLKGVVEVGGFKVKFDTPAVMDWGFKNGFDLFGLIDAGLAIDSKTL